MNSLQQLSPQELELQTRAAIELAKRRCRQPNGFKWFVYNVFAYNFSPLVGGAYIDEVCEVMEAHNWTIDVTARDHFKSTRLYAEIMYDLFISEAPLEAHYFSYNTTLSRYHLKKVKTMIKDNPFFVFCTDLNPLSDTQLEYFNGVTRYSCAPQGLLSFKRGIHAERIYVDDPLKDPENKLAPALIYRINRIISTEIFAMVKRGGKCRVVGTPQTNEDFFFDNNLQTRFYTRILDAIVDEANKVALWSEWKTYDELIQIRNIIGERTFNQEYRCKPAYSEDSYINRQRLINLINPDLTNQQRYEGDNDVVGGFDIGKHAHPSHLALYEKFYIPERSIWYYRQLLTLWLDNWEYSSQVEHLAAIIDLFNVSVLRYDNTRGEFESFAEQGKLPKQMKPVNFSLKSKTAMAASFDAIVTGERVELINDQRQTNQILAVTSDLNAFESADGHGDSFWSNAMALLEEKQKQYAARTV
jgi:hypothetical protein